MFGRVTDTEVLNGGELDVEKWKEGRTISGRGDYILGTRGDFSMVGLREPRTPTEHQMVLGVICGDRVMRHRAYIKGRTTWPILEDKGRTR